MVPEARLVNALKIVCFFQLTCVGWLIFRARGFRDIVAKFEAVLFYTKVNDFWTPDAGRLAAFVVPFLIFEYSSIFFRPTRAMAPLALADPDCVVHRIADLDCDIDARSGDTVYLFSILADRLRPPPRRDRMRATQVALAA